MCTAFPRVLTTTQNSEKFSKNQLQSLKYYPEQKSDYCVKEKSQTNQNKPHQCGSHASKWKLRKRKHLHFCVGILYFSYGLWSWLFPSSSLNLGILFPFPVTVVSAIVSPEQKNFFNVDLYQPPESSQEFIENFGPGTFSFSEDAASDEANDAQLYLDMVQSIQSWQRNKQMRHKRVKRDEEEVCYLTPQHPLGCFRDEGPFDYLDMLPSHPEEINTAMMLFTRQNFEKAQFIEYNNISSVQESHYNATLDTKIIIHGFGSSCNRVWAREMRLSFLAVEDVNVICVDWSAGAADPNYVRAAVNTRLVGKQVAILVENINESIGKSITPRTHIVGFSLGAHVAGFAGTQLKNLSRITGLDPAGPLFEGYDGKVRLDKNDADYVDVIHSNGESLIVGGFGTWEPIGHVDFYPNGGRAQRGCQHFLVGGLYDFIYSYQGNDTSTYRYLCNHRRAYKFFTDSISPKCYFTSFPCENYDKFQAGECFDCNKGQECGRLGYYSNQAKGRGSLYMLTRDEEPFCGTQYMVNILFSRSRGPVQTYGKLQLMLVDKNGINETFTVTKDVDDLMTSGTKIEKIISVHPVIEPVTAYLLYVAYDGWIFSGRLVWRVDKISLREGRTGAYLSHCKSNEAETVLRSGIPAEFDLMTGDCNVPPIGLDYFLPPYNTKFPKKPKPVTHPDHFPVLQHITNEPISNTLIPPPPPPPPSNPTSSPTLATSKPSTPNEFIMETKIVPIPESGEDLENAIQINDEVAPASVPDTTTSKEALKKTEYTLVNVKPEEKQDNNPKVVQVWDSLAPSAVPDTIKRPYLKPKRKFVTTSIPTTSRGQQHHLYRPPTAKPESASFWPGFLDFFSGSEVKTTSMRPMPPITYHRRPLIPTTDTNKRIQEDDNDKPGNMITLYSSNKNGTTQEQHVTMHHLSSDEQLTILKVDQDQNNKTDDKDPGDEDNDVNLDTTANQKSAYIVLHKLPNGEALNLENLETYSSMADVESEIKKSKPYYQPRSLLPPLIVSQRPFVTPEPYEPIPLDQLDDLEAMPDSEPPPVYIINPLKGDLNVTGEIQPPTEEEVEEAIKQANVELFKLNQTHHSKGERQEKLLTAVFLQPNEDLTSTTDRSISTSPQSTTKDFFEAQTVVYDFNWTPIPKRPTFGPSRAPPNYRPIKLDSVKQLSGIAQVSIPDSGAIADELRSSNSQTGPEGPPVVNVQLLPPRLSAVLFQVNEKRRALYGRYPPGFHRQNKISPVFKIDPTGLNRKKSKSMDSLFREPPQPRHSSHGRRLRSNPLRRFQTQLVPGSSDPHKYIPLRVKPTHHPKLWWQPMTSTYSKVTIVNPQKPSSSGLDDPDSEEAENTTSSSTTSEPDENVPSTTIEPMDDTTTEDEEVFNDNAEETTTQQPPEQDEE